MSRRTNTRPHYFPSNEALARAGRPTQAIKSQSPPAGVETVEEFLRRTAHLPANPPQVGYRP